MNESYLVQMLGLISSYKLHNHHNITEGYWFNFYVLYNSQELFSDKLRKKRKLNKILD